VTFRVNRVEDYEQTIGFLPHIVHFHPPTMVQTMRLNRFSPYFEYPAKYGIRNIQPRPAYREILPEDAVIADIAYNFVGEFESAIRSHPGTPRSGAGTRPQVENPLDRRGSSSNPVVDPDRRRVLSASRFQVQQQDRSI